MTFYSIALFDNYPIFFSATLKQLQPQFTIFLKEVLHNQDRDERADKFNYAMYYF